MPHGGDLLVRLAREHGVDAVFGVVSVHNLPLVDALARAGLFVPVRHEAAAVNAADAYARVSNGLGIAVTSTGTGAGNAAGALIEAQTASSSVLHVTGQIDAAYLDSGRGVIHETRDQLGMLRAVSAHAERIETASAAAAVLWEAAREAAATASGPASVEWPIDLQYAQQPAEPPAPNPSTVDDQDRSVDGTTGVHPVDVATAVELLGASRRPVIWAGGGAVSAGDSVRLLAEHLDAAVVTSNSGRGTIAEDHELVVGNFASSPGAAELLSEADLLIAIGTHFRSNETKHYELALPSRLLQIDIDPRAIGRSYPATAGVVGDAAAVLPRLLETVGESGTAPGWRERVPATRRRVRAELIEAIGPYAPMCESLRHRLPREAVIARDVTIPSSQWGNRLLEIYRPETNVFPVGGGIGQGLAMGIGAAMARPDHPTAVLAGDGGIAVHLGELATLAQQRPWLVVVLFNDGGYGVLRNMQEAHTGQRAGVDLHTPDFAKLAASLDLPHQLVNKAERFDEAFAKALAERGPAVVEVDVTALSVPTPFVPPVHVPAR
ncbi:thiamine pyrophosphate-binding protein [Prauserella alba]|uniref:Thiamine pyrophosphate-binding protein n=1 Tax=Prauserella alba TaxID=176898 RepID=A0ABN1VF94_9PSEU|nr:thiamine pyrophosphate-binding protein [Prauserella alba]MCP2178916.1 acetolactate synthase-1/2/3 large subunit [Prauserella alba]